MCVVCKSAMGQFVSVRAGKDVLKVFSITTPVQALTHLRRGKRSGAFCQDDLSALVRDGKLCQAHIQSYADALITCADLASEE